MMNLYTEKPRLSVVTIYVPSVKKFKTGSLQVHRAGMGIYSQDRKSEEIKGGGYLTTAVLN